MGFIDKKNGQSKLLDSPFLGFKRFFTKKK